MLDSFRTYAMDSFDRRPGNKEVVLHFQGFNSKIVYPPTEYFAKGCMIINRPWSEDMDNAKINKERTWGENLELYLDEENCPMYLKMQIERLKANYRSQFAEQTLREIGTEDALRDVDLDNPLDADYIRLIGQNTFVNVEAFNLDYGTTYDWKQKKVITEAHLSGLPNPTKWLRDVIRADDILVDQTLNCGFDKKELYNHDVFCPSKATREQFEIISKVYDKAKEWLSFTEDKEKENFENLRMTVCGEGGTGKSFVIHTIANMLVLMVKEKFACLKACLGGAAASLINGQTLHSLLGLRPNKDNNDRDTVKYNLSVEKLAQLQERYLHSIALLIDERSMVDAQLLEHCDLHAQKIFNSNKFPNKHFGNIPIIVMFGDDAQLPPINKKHSLVRLYGTDKHENSFAFRSSPFIRFMDQVQILSVIKRQVGEENEEFRQILKRLRDDIMTVNDADVLKEVHISKQSKERRKLIDEKAIYVFARNRDVDEKNMEELKKLVSTENPVAKVTSVKMATSAFNKTHFRNNGKILPNELLICRGSRIMLTHMNYRPQWKIYNGAMGTIMDIHYSCSTGPNREAVETVGGDIPSQSPLDRIPTAVFVKMDIYNGPQYFDTLTYPDLENVIPFSVMEQSSRCKYNCCHMKNLPFGTSHATTIHKFQGTTVGRGNTISCLVGCPGAKALENSIGPGLLYVLLGRATTIGSKSNNREDSSFYFNETQDTLALKLRSMDYLKSNKYFHDRKLIEQYFARLKMEEMSEEHYKEKLAELNVLFSIQ